MKHFGDITKINGADVPAVDVICGGSPCQDLSVAGKRAGLSGERSGLFMEQIRIVKEMRENDRANGRTDKHIRSGRFLVWENVPGALSSNKGEDFRIVLEEICRIKDKTATVPMPEKGKWSTSGIIMGDGYSVAWRVHDAQFWGVPQRRKRIALVADFGGESAPEILFERKGLSGNIEESRKEGQGTSTDTERSIDKTIQNSYGFPLGFRAENTKVYDEKATTLCNGTRPGFTNGIIQDTQHASCNQGEMMIVQGADMYNQSLTGEKTMSITGAATDPHHIPCVVLEGNGQRESHKGDGYKESDVMYTLNTVEQHAVCHTFRKQGHPQNAEQGQGWKETAVNDTLNAFDSGETRTPTLVVEKTVYDWHRQDTRMTECKDVCVTCAAGWGGGGNNMPYVLESEDDTETVIRRLTPLECERLQGFPDGWTDIGEWIDTKGKKHKDADSPRYKALGNSIALPFWQWMAERMVAELDNPNPTMASLFDGIGGFPLVFSRCGCDPVWASEIEEFPIAVTKLRFPEKEKNNG